MMVMPGNNKSGFVHYWAAKCPGKLGHLWSPGGKITTYDWLPYALDNGEYTAWENNRPWNADIFIKHVEDAVALPKKPIWIVVPDVRLNAQATLEKWHDWESKLRPFGVPLAFALQDGIDFNQIPKSADVIFVGGTDEWRYPRLREIVALGKPVHVGRVNTAKRLWQCYRNGVSSIDGSKWFAYGPNTKDFKALKRYLMLAAGEIEESSHQLALIEQANLKRDYLDYGFELFDVDDAGTELDPLGLEFELEQILMI